MESLVGELGLTVGTFVVCLVSGFVPVVSAELFLIAVAVAAPWETMAAVALAATAGQMVAKMVSFLAGVGVVKLPLRRFRQGIEKHRNKIEEKWKSGPDWLIFVSALAGLPPFYVISILAGTLGVRWPRFLVVGSLGRLIRFAACLVFPQLAKSLIAG